jgi:hypothetical protein
LSNLEERTSEEASSQLLLDQSGAALLSSSTPLKVALIYKEDDLIYKVVLSGRCFMV